MDKCFLMCSEIHF